VPHLAATLGKDLVEMTVHRLSSMSKCSCGEVYPEAVWTFVSLNVELCGSSRGGVEQTIAHSWQTR
jgi:hypothetical protein